MTDQAFTHDAAGRNPALPSWLHIPDPEAHTMPDGRLYVYGSWDTSMDTFCSERYRVVSTEDLRTWTVHAVAFDGRDVPWVADPRNPDHPGGFDPTNPSPFLRGMLTAMGLDLDDPSSLAAMDAAYTPPPAGFLFAPDAVARDDRYHLYFCKPDQSEGVAFSDRPEGPFVDPVRLPCAGIDPAVLLDDDGRAYYYWGQFHSRGAELAEDMASFIPGTEVENLLTEEDHFFHEGTSIRRRGDTYYAVYSAISTGRPTSLDYATASSPLGPYTYRGRIIDNGPCDPASWNNHGSIEEFDGRWYVFYHRSHGNTQNGRRLCVEPIVFNDDGTIDEVLMTSTGVGAPFALGERIEAWRACEVTGTLHVTTTDELAGGTDGGTATFRYVDFSSATRSVHVEGDGGPVTIHLDDRPHDAITVPVLGEPARCVLPAGRHTVRVTVGADARISSLTFG